MLNARQIREFKERGVLVGPRVYSPEECARLKDRLLDVVAGRSETRPEAVRNLLGSADRVVIQIINIWRADASFRRHLYHPLICEMVSQLTNHSVVRVWHDQVQYKPPRVGGITAWHQDFPFWPVIEPANLVTAWVPLEDATVENGCMWIVPGSHRWGVYNRGIIGTDPRNFAPTPDAASLPAEAEVCPTPYPVPVGQVLFHHCLTWHGSPANGSGHGRPAIAVHYMPGHTRYEPERTHFLQRYITVGVGQPLEGPFFPTVWDNGPAEAT
jgi:phytanoyl-CoA hydroxylase